jgi:hypothetical protein
MEGQPTSRLALAAFALALVPPIARAGDLVTPAAFVGSSTTASCKLLNVTSSTISAQIQLRNSTGTVLNDSGPVTLGAGAAISRSYANPSDMVYCRFIKASKSKVRASLNIFSLADDTTDHTVVMAQ